MAYLVAAGVHSRISGERQRFSHVAVTWLLAAATDARLPSTMSFQDIETGQSRPAYQSSVASQSQEDSTFLSLQSSLSLQVFKINSNVQGILKLVDQLGTTKDSPSLRKQLCVNLIHPQLKYPQ